MRAGLAMCVKLSFPESEPCITCLLFSVFLAPWCCGIQGISLHDAYVAIAGRETLLSTTLLRFAVILPPRMFAPRQ
jgi:hypothetical protein